ncbi:DUF6493 family protein [Streptomyces sp. ST2-7A]|uniref:DUF6493 family protein n=1 Tax=Streptomyces sp. ST2-7A TaxID=2907214 RepID=UPI001F44650B|nr:DUF6493 family protein [Streptomyces sp. ST2-7A]MCE7080677.1 DUF6493 family protein [Streptomyces sp. ST2-7A]
MSPTINRPAGRTDSRATAGLPDPETLARLRRKAGGEPSAALVSAVEEAAQREIPTLLADLDDAARRALVPELKRLRRENRWRRPGIHRAAHLAGAGCHTGAVACATWLAARGEFFEWRDTTPFLEVLAGRPPEFLAKVVERFADRSELQPWEVDLLIRLADAAGVEPPPTEGFVAGWSTRVHGVLHERTRLRRRRARRERGTPGPAAGSTDPDPGSTDPVEPHGDLLTLLREDPLTPRLMPVLLDTRECPGRLHTLPEPPPGVEHPLDTWPGALAHLAGEGLLDRGAMIGTALAVAVRAGHTLPDVRFHVALLRALEPTVEEAADRMGNWTRLLADAPIPAAGYAQEVLRDLWEKDRLPVERLAEASRTVFFRTEKKLIRTQLSLLDAVMRARPETVSLLLPTIGEVFGHTDTALRERALRVVGRRVRHADRAACEELITAAELLGPGLLDTAAELLDAPDLLALPGPEPAGSHIDALPEPRAPLPLPAPAGTPEEFVADLNAALTADLRGSGTALGYEWVLDGLVRLAHRDRAALVAALAPVTEAHPEWLKGTNWLQYGRGDLMLPVAAAAGGITVDDILKVRRTLEYERCRHIRFFLPHRRRTVEIAYALLTSVPPFLLSMPDDESGALDPEVLLDRLRSYRDEGVSAVPIDLDVALLRSRRPDDPSVLAARAREVGTPEGTRFAEWLEGPGLPPFPTERVRAEVVEGRESLRMVSPPFPHPVALLPSLGELGDGYLSGPAAAGRSHLWCHCALSHASHWASLVPHRPDGVAIHLIQHLENSALWNDRPETRQLIALAEAPGPAGPALHLAIAYGLSARHPDDRLATVDAILALAGRGEFDAARLGSDLAELVGLGAVKVNRVTDALALLVPAGAPATAWAVLSVLLPALLAPGGTPPRGAADLLAAAAEAVETCGARGEHGWLHPLADRKGGSRLVTEAGRLRRALTA